MIILTRIGRFIALVWETLPEPIAPLLAGLPVLYLVVQSGRWGDGKSVDIVTKSLICGAAYLIAVAVLACIVLLIHNVFATLSRLWAKSAYPL
jgi:hypothetical protein